MRPKKPKGPLRWTEERKDYLRKTWAAVVPKEVIFSTLNAMPGPAVSRQMISSYANGTMGLRRPDAIHAYNRLIAIDKLAAHRMAALHASLETRRENKERRLEAQKNLQKDKRSRPARKPKKQPTFPRKEPFSMAAMAGPDPRLAAFREQIAHQSRGRLDEGYAHPVTVLIKD